MTDRRPRKRTLFLTERPMVASLGLLVALLGQTGCRNDDSTSAEPSQLAVSAGSISLTYICGNSFRVRNTNEEAVDVRWDVYGTTETGTLRLAPKPVIAPYSEAFFTTVNRGTVRLYSGATLLATKANGNRPPCALPTDTTRPPIPDNNIWVGDPALVVPLPSDTSITVYRNYFDIRFDDSTSGSTIRALLAAHRGEIVGGHPPSMQYVVRFPDPGPRYEDMETLRRAFMARPGVRWMIPLVGNTKAEIFGRYPSDGTNSPRSAWTGPANPFTESRRRLRAPLAWGCENGLYATSAPSLGIVDHEFDVMPSDFEPIVAVVRPPSNAAIEYSPYASQPRVTSHGMAIAGILAARGDNGHGVAGIVWGAPVTFFALMREGRKPPNLTRYLSDQILPEAARRGVRILVSSVNLPVADSLESQRLRAALLAYAASGGLFVQAVGNAGTTATIESLLGMRASNLGLLQAVAYMFSSTAPASARDHFLLVGGTDRNGRFWRTTDATGSNFISGATELLAPAEEIGTLARATDVDPTIGMSGGFQISSGTSMSAPFVAGTAALLLAMEPTLTAAEVKSYLLRGTHVAREQMDGTLREPESPGAPDAAVGELDAYGALTLLSRERHGTPVCGLDVEGRSQPDGTYRLVANRDSPEVLAELSAFDGGWTFSVAQGGRQLAIDGFGVSGYQSIPFSLRDGRWFRQQAVPGVIRLQYLERDTAYFSFRDGAGNNFDLWLRLGSDVPSRAVADQPLTAGLIGDGAIWNVNANYIAPTGDFVVVDWVDAAATCDRPYSLYAVDVRRGAGKNVIAQGCRDGVNVNTATAWRGDGEQLLTIRSGVTPTGLTVLDKWNTGATWSRVGGTAEDGRGDVIDATWSPEGQRIAVTSRPQWDRCEYAVRSADRLSIVEGPWSLMSQFCQDPIMQRMPAIRDPRTAIPPGPGTVLLRELQKGPPRRERIVRRVN